MISIYIKPRSTVDFVEFPSEIKLKLREAIDVWHYWAKNVIITFHYVVKMVPDRQFSGEKARSQTLKTHPSSCSSPFFPLPVLQ